MSDKQETVALSKKYMCRVWFFCPSLGDRLLPLTLAFMVPLVTHCDVSQKPFLSSLSPPCEGSDWPRCVRLLPPQGVWLYHKEELDGGKAGNMISTQRARGWEFCPCVWICGMSEASRANTCSLLDDCMTELST